MILGKAIKEIRKVRGVSQKKLAELCNMSANGMCNIENGLSFPPKETIGTICKALRIPQSYLLLSCLEETDIAEEKRILFRTLVEPLKKELLSDTGKSAFADA